MRKYALRIIGWDEHQERPDRLNYSWFKFHAKTINGHFWSETSAEELKVWICLLCLRNGQSGDLVVTNDLTLAGYCNLKPSQISEIIDALCARGSLRDETRAETAPTRTTRPNIVEESRVEENTVQLDLPDPLTPAWLGVMWNEHCGPLQKLKTPLKLNPKRRSYASQRLKEHPNCEDWISAIIRVAKSPKCQGKLNPKDGPYVNWAADFEWFIKPGRLDQILEGKWDGPKASEAPHPFTLSQREGA